MKDISQIVLDAQTTINQIKVIISAPIYDKELKQLGENIKSLKKSVNEMGKWVDDEQVTSKNN